MWLRDRLRLAGTLAALATAGGLGACGGSSGSTKPRVTITVLMAQAPDSLDPGLASNQQALEAEWLVYTPLLTYVHAGERAGTQVVAGLASGLPVVSEGGRLYTLTLRPGLVYSNGRRVRASDFARAVQRTIRLRWPLAPDLILDRISGAAAYARGAASSISGIAANDATGQITIHLTQPDGSFENVLALPALAPVPPGTPLRDLSRRPPPGVGPYAIARVRLGRSFSLRVNPRWARIHVAGIRAGRVDVHVRIGRDAAANARTVLRGKADVLDWADPLPATAAQLVSGAHPGYATKPANETYLIFMDVASKPFSSALVRHAVAAALDASGVSRLAPGGLLPGCYPLPPDIVGHPSKPCPEGDPANGGPLSAAGAIVQRSGMAGVAARVWVPAAPPFRQWAAYYLSLLRRLSIRARLTADPGRAQTGIVALAARLPNPAAFYRELLVTHEIADQHVEREVRTLRAIPAGELSAVEDLWQDLDEYVARNAYVAVIGYRTVPEVISERIDLKAVVLSPVFGYDWTSFRVK